MLDGAKILRETWCINELVPLYDNEDSVCGVIYNDHPFYFRKNLQGDVIAITDWAGLTVARYTYDAWGKCTIVDLARAHEIATVNPFRYRSYYYDSETALYYLQSHYYDPTLGRFINGDKVMGANNDFATYQLYAYCGNCPIDRYDAGGCFWKKIVNNVKKKIVNVAKKAQKIIAPIAQKIKPVVRKVLKQGNMHLVQIGVDTAAFGARWLDMTQDRQGIYHANFDCWQQYFGYNDFYDFMFDLGTSMRNVRFPFNYGNRSYIIWAWKGDYINLGAGAELGIYYGGSVHWFVDKKLAMNMSMVLKYKGKQIISYANKTWWITGFNPQYLGVLPHDLRASFTVKFNNNEMFAVFASKYQSQWQCNYKTKTASYTF